MKLKRRFKTALGAIMAAVMVVTAVPVTGDVVQAAETVQSEEITEETPESLSEETEQDSRTQTEEQQQYEEEKNESQADEETTEERGTEQQSVTPDETEGESETESVSHNGDEDSSTQNYQTGHVVNGKDVTFTYVDETGQYTSVGITGSMTDPTWSNTSPILLDEVTLESADGNKKVWQKTFSYGAGDYEYQFIPDNTWVESNRALTIAGLLEGKATAVKGQETVLPTKGKNHVAKEQDEEIDVEYAVDADHPLPEGITFNEQDQSVTIAENYSAADTEFTLKMMDKNDSDNTNTIVVVIQGKVYTEDPDVQSPVVGKGEATFYYFGPTISISEGVKINYGQQGASWPKESMTFNDETGYWWITLQLAVGTYEYGFLVGSGETWTLDPLNSNKAANGNTIVTISEGSENEEYLGPTINYNPSAEGDNDPGAVTFYFDGSAAEAVIVKGAWDASWGDKIKLEKDEGTGLYQVEIPTSKLTTIGTYEYGFETGSTQNEEGIWSGTWSPDTKNPHKDGNSRIYRNPQVDKENNVTLYYYPAHGTYPDKVAVKYREKTESGDSSYTELEMVRDDIDAAVYSASISNAKVNAVYEYYFEVTADGKTTEIQDTNNATAGEFALVDYPEEPEGLTSPVVEGSQVTFNYYDPQAESQGKTVSVAGDWTSWEKNPVEMEYNSGTGVWSVTCTLSKGEHEYKFIVGNDWKVDPKNETQSEGGNSLVEVTAGGVSEYPAIEGNKITFSYVNDALADDEQVSVVGSMNGWTKHAPEYMMQKNAESGEWELTVSLSPGVYSYKFFYGDSSSDDGWTSDIRNTNPLTDDKDKNNQFFVAGLEHGKTDIARGGNVKLPPALKLYDIEGNSKEVTVTYAFSDETAGAAYKDNITLDGVNLSITGDFPEDVKSFTLTAADGNNNTSVVTVSVVDAVYSYTIYYYDRDESHRSTDASALWIWNEVKAGEVSADGGTEHNFDEAVELSDGNTWLKATVKLSYTELGIIPKNKGNGSWIWQESTRTYTNADASEEVTLYIVNELPDKSGDLK